MGPLLKYNMLHRCGWFTAVRLFNLSSLRKLRSRNEPCSCRNQIYDCVYHWVYMQSHGMQKDKDVTQLSCHKLKLYLGRLSVKKIALPTILCCEGVNIEAKVAIHVHVHIYLFKFWITVNIKKYSNCFNFCYIEAKIAIMFMFMSTSMNFSFVVIEVKVAHAAIRVHVHIYLFKFWITFNIISMTCHSLPLSYIQ